MFVNHIHSATATTQGHRGASPTLLAKTPHKTAQKKDDSHCCKSSWWWEQRESKRSWRGYLCAQGISPSNKINISPQPRIHVQHRLANTNGWDCHGEEWRPKAAGDGEGCAMLASEQTATTTAQGRKPHTPRKNASQNDTKKRRPTFL